MAEMPGKGSPRAAEREDDIVERRTLRDYYIILRERLWIALPLALLISVGYGYHKMQAIPIYGARATMQFEKPETVVTAQGVVDQAVRSDIDLNTYITILGSQTLRTRVLESFKPAELDLLRRAALKRSPPGTAPGSVPPSLGWVQPFSSRNSYVIDINVTHEDPEAAALVANRYVESFMGYLFENAGGANKDAIRYLSEQALRLQRESEAAENELQSYMKQHNLLSLDSSQNLVGDALRKAGMLRDEARLSLMGIEAKMRQIEEYQAQGKNLLEIPEIAGHGAVPSLKAQLSKLQQEQNLLSERYLERHPEMIKKANEIAVTETDLERAKSLAIAELRARQAEVKKQYTAYQEEFDKREKASMNLGDLAVQFRSLQRQADVNKENYMTILKRLNETRTLKGIEKVPVHPLDRAMPSFGPISPNKTSITRTCIGIGVLVFFGVAVGLSFIDDRVKSSWDIESFIGANLLGIIPDLASMKDEEKYTLLLDNKQAPGTEAFLSVYSSIKINSRLDFPKSILVTSTIPGEGKTLISCNVAGSFARHGKKTLLVDCDLRRPMLHRHFKQQNNAGLLAWFDSGGAMEGDLTTNPVLGIIKLSENLFLLCSGGRSKSPTELLENPLFGQLLERLKREFDLIIVDSPPLGAVTDSLLIAERIDEVVYVCRFNRAYRKHIRLYMRALRSGKNEVLGIVLNGLSPRRIEYYSNYRYYRSYKKYYGAQA
ncbi:MAG: polysaccharide biosynthesis tyrosine autokinase [Opitutaceae bacterium]|nr:polysaccharide biosynthesis tyrosine autokinase [Opitutaceae bacterium]